jgi:putative DNA primase/helicase
VSEYITEEPSSIRQNNDTLSATRRKLSAINPDDVEIERLMQLPPFEYGRARKDSAKSLGVPVSMLDDEVKKCRDIYTEQSGKSGQGTAVVLESPEPWDDVVSGLELAQGITDTLSKHIIVDEDQLAVIAFWVLHTYCFECFQHTPRLNVTAPEKGCGKTLVLDILERLTPRAIRTENISSPVMFRLTDAQNPTLLIDEYDTFLGDSEELRGALNAGFMRGGRHLRCEGEGNEVRQFKTFTPVALAGIRALPPTLHDRSIILCMKRATRQETRQITPFDSRRDDHLKVMARRCARWAKDHHETLNNSDPTMPDGFFNRVCDRWRALFSIADCIGGKWPSALRGIALKLETVDKEETLAIMLLEDMRAIFQERDRIHSEDLVIRLQSIGDGPWSEYGRKAKPINQRQVSNLLKGFDIRPKNCVINSGQRKGYEKDQFEDAFSRYLEPLCGSCRPAVQPP